MIIPIALEAQHLAVIRQVLLELGIFSVSAKHQLCVFSALNHISCNTTRLPSVNHFLLSDAFRKCVGWHFFRVTKVQKRILKEPLCKLITVGDAKSLGVNSDV